MTSPSSESAASTPFATAAEVRQFWLDAGAKRWFNKDEAFDTTLRARFLATYQAAASGTLNRWADTPDDAVALLIVLDQFPRNMFRNSAQAFATDPQALAIAKAALARGFDRATAMPLRQFFYLPLMHSENLADQERCLSLYAALNDADLSKWAVLHADIIRRFGRFPHRNDLLGRTTTAAEQEFLDSGGFAG
jgi:uncharacterized protein (DUF924 family)